MESRVSERLGGDGRRETGDGGFCGSGLLKVCIGAESEEAVVRQLNEAGCDDELDFRVWGEGRDGDGVGRSRVFAMEQTMRKPRARQDRPKKWNGRSWLPVGAAKPQLRQKKAGTTGASEVRGGGFCFAKAGEQSRKITGSLEEPGREAKANSRAFNGGCEMDARCPDVCRQVAHS